MKLIKSIYVTLTLCNLLGCGNKSEDPIPTPPPIVTPPTQTTKAVLISPAKDETCFTGVFFTSELNKITFKWNPSNFAKDYTITVKNLVTSEITTATTTYTQKELVLAKKVAYSWSVSTNSSLNTSTLSSDVWRFYNAGEATSAFAPYPAELTKPLMNAKVNPYYGNIMLAWEGSDPDADIHNYDVYFGTAENPPLFKNTHGIESISVPVSPATTYYWKIITNDRSGNKSASTIFKFTVL